MLNIQEARRTLMRLEARSLFVRMDTIPVGGFGTNRRMENRTKAIIEDAISKHERNEHVYVDEYVSNS